MGVGHYENFPVASMLCPPQWRDTIRSIYAFARTADDIADEGNATEGARLQDLRRFRAALQIASSGPGAGVAESAWPEIFAPLAREIERQRLPLVHLHALLDAFEQDVRNPRYATREAVLDYCRRSADPVGRLLLHLYGIDDAASLQESDAICTALQLINFWQDLSVDVPRGRIYVPDEDCARHALDPRQLSEPAGDLAARSLVKELVRWAATTLARGAPLPLRIPGRAGWELRFVVHGGWRILEKIAHMEFRSYLQRPRLGAVDVPVLAWRSLRYSPSQFSPASLG